MKIKEAAERLEVSVATAYALVASGKLRASRIGLGRGVIRISEEQLADYLRRAEQESLPTPPPEVETSPSKRQKFIHLDLN